MVCNNQRAKLVFHKQEIQRGVVPKHCPGSHMVTVFWLNHLITLVGVSIEAVLAQRLRSTVQDEHWA